MTFRLAASTAACFFSALAAAAASPYGAPVFGLMVLGQGEGPEWRKTEEDVRRDAGRVPVEFVPGIFYRDSLQRAVDRLEDAGAGKIVAVPLCVGFSCDGIQESREILGLAAAPAGGGKKESFSWNDGGASRVDVRVPLVMTPPLNDSPILASVLVSRAGELSRDPSKEAVVLVEPFFPSDSSDPKKSAEEKTSVARKQAAAAALAEKVRQGAGFAAAAAKVVLMSGYGSDLKESSRSGLAALVRSLRLKGLRVIVVPLDLDGQGVSAELPGALDGLFAAFNGRAILPDPRVAAWAAAAGRSGASLEDMRIPAARRAWASP